jgi:ATP-binding cassette subfamily F protein 3
VGHRVEPAYFSQQGEELRDDRTVVETVLAAGDLTQTQARTLLGAFLFRGEAADARVERLSGGERRRLSLVALIARGGNLLVLDEPTNHLDTESREALEEALEAFDGTILLVSHDRALIDAIATHTLSLEDGGAVVRAGGWTDLRRARQGAAAPSAPVAPAPRRTEARRAAPAAGGRPRRRPGRHTDREVKRLETEIARVEASIAEVETALSDPAAIGDRAAVAARGEEHRGLQEELAWLMREWERAAEAAAG